MTVGYDRVMENLPNRKVVSVRETHVQCQSEKDHYKVEIIVMFSNFIIFFFKEWESDEKLKPETRKNIRRDYLAMIKKEKDLRSNQRISSVKSVAYTTVDQPAQGKIRMKNKINIQENVESADIKDNIKENQINFHGDNCKTCKRMLSVMGDILPHPLNV